MDNEKTIQIKWGAGRYRFFPPIDVGQQERLVISLICESLKELGVPHEQSDFEGICRNEAFVHDIMTLILLEQAFTRKPHRLPQGQKSPKELISDVITWLRDQRKQLKIDELTNPETYRAMLFQSDPEWRDYLNPEGI